MFKRNGFTLIETAIVVMVTGMMMAGLANVYKTYYSEKKIVEMEEDISAIRDGIYSFTEDDPLDTLDNTDHRFPCPAPLKAAPGDSNYGVEQRDNTTGACIVSASTGITQFPSSGAALGYIGAVPTKTLDIPDAHAVDVYGNKFTYAITAGLTVDDAILNDTSGAITIMGDDSQGGNGGTTTTGAQFVVVSHGPDGTGSYTETGVLNASVCASSTKGDSENCNGDGVFRVSDAVAQAGTNRDYDDEAVFTLQDGVTTNQWWILSDNSTTDIHNSNTGKVGVGVEVPQSTLHIKDTLFVGKNLVEDPAYPSALNVDGAVRIGRISSDASGATFGPKLYFSGAGKNPSMPDNENNDSIWLARRYGSGYTGGEARSELRLNLGEEYCPDCDDISSGQGVDVFSIGTSGTIDDNGAVIDSNLVDSVFNVWTDGRVGVGVRNPWANFHVAGDIAFGEIRNDNDLTQPEYDAVLNFYGGRDWYDASDPEGDLDNMMDDRFIIHRSNDAKGKASLRLRIGHSPYGSPKISDQLRVVAGEDDVNGVPGENDIFVVDSKGPVTMNRGPMTIGTSLPVNIANMLLTVRGDAEKAGGGPFSAISDIRLKDVDGPYERGLDDVTRLDPVLFHYKKDNPLNWASDDQYVGFVAQDVQKIFPEAVYEAKDGYLRLNTQSINVAMVNAFKELKQKNADLVNAVKELKTENDDLEAQLKALTERLDALEAKEK